MIEDFVKRAIDSIKTLEETEGDHELLIENSEMNVDLIEIKWQKFLAYEMELEKRTRKQLK